MKNRISFCQKTRRRETNEDPDEEREKRHLGVPGDVVKKKELQLPLN